MPPHCDTLDGPVVKAARTALDNGNVNLILPYLPKRAEREAKKAFQQALATRKLGRDARNLADRWFFETVVRLHREGEGAPYTGLKPAGLDVGPVIPKAEAAIEKGNPSELIRFLSHTLEEELTKKFDDLQSRSKYDVSNVATAREYIHRMLGFEVYSHHLYTIIKGHGGEELGEHEHSAA